MAPILPVPAWALAGLMLGAIVGSYLATIVLRWPKGEAARGRSRCDGCGVTLGPGDLIPLLSFLIRRGRCRRCGAAIDPRHLLVEGAAALIGASAFAVAPGVEGLAGALFGWLLLALAALDLEHFWLPDRLTLMLAAFGVAGGLAGIGPPLPDRLIGGVAGFGSLAVIAFAYKHLRDREGMGGGDPKLFGAIGLWLGWAALPGVILLASIVGLAIVALQRLRGRAIDGGHAVPLGAQMAIAAWPAWFFVTLTQFGYGVAITRLVP